MSRPGGGCAVLGTWTTASTSASCSPVATSPATTRRPADGQLRLPDRRPRDRRGGRRSTRPTTSAAARRPRAPTACASPARSPPTTTPTTSAATMMGHGIEGIARAARAATPVPIHVQADEAPWVQQVTGVGRRPTSSPHDSGDTVMVGRDPDRADPHAGPHAGQPVLPRRRPPRRRRHAVPRGLRPHRPARRRRRRSCTRASPRRSPRCPTTPCSSPATSTRRSRRRTMARDPERELRVPPADRRAVADDVRRVVTDPSDPSEASPSEA